MKTLSIGLVALLLFSFSACTAPLYHKGDIAVINAIIENNGLKCEKAPADGSSVPEDWDFEICVTWSDDETNKRIIELDLFTEKLIGRLDLSRLAKLEILDCSYNDLTSLNVSGLANLKKLDCSDNELTSLKVSGLSALEVFDCSCNELASLKLSGLANLKNLNCWSNQLTSLDLSGLTNLTELDCDYNNLSSLDISKLPNLKNLKCD
ncbi:MAG: leucine-rich repeat domain-containing protein, partial [Tannerellaceae bacterium]|nr:leucine-rich repeat domain-containing protein [Tannerellaceae bacterium]